MKRRVLIIEDEQRIRRLLKLILVQEGFDVSTAEDGQRGMEVWHKVQPDVVLTDLKMPKADGLELLDFRNRSYQQTPLIIITAFGTVSNAVTAMKQGACDYLIKPIDNDHLLRAVRKAIRDNSNTIKVTENSSLQPEQMIGSCAAMQKVYEEIDLVASTSLSVLVTGESGTGKELVAKAIHANTVKSGEKSKPFIKVNCAAIPRDLLESELFGHVRGAFTGAVGERRGAFSLADGGTIFLDEIGDLPIELQPKLLHAVEEKSVTPVGAAAEIKVDVKIIAATNCDLDAMVKGNKFRTDLYHRLNGYPIHLPPLRQRETDVDELVEYFLSLFCQEQGRGLIKISDPVRNVFQKYSWPGNVRELRNIVERAVLMCKGELLVEELLPEKILSQKELVVRVEALPVDSQNLFIREKQLIVAALKECGWNKSQSARKLGITRNTLRYRMKKYEINPPSVSL